MRAILFATVMAVTAGPVLAEDEHSDTQLLREAFIRNDCKMSDDERSAAILREAGFGGFRIGPPLTELLQSGEVVPQPDGLTLTTGPCDNA